MPGTNFRATEHALGADGHASSNMATCPGQATRAVDARVQPWKAWLGDTVDTGFDKEGVDDALNLKSGVQDNGIAS